MTEQESICNRLNELVEYKNRVTSRKIMLVSSITRKGVVSATLYVDGSLIGDVRSDESRYTKEMDRLCFYVESLWEKKRPTN